MTEYPKSGIELEAKTKNYTSAMEEAIFLADYLDSIGSISLDVSADVDLGSADSEIDDLIQLDGESVNFTVEAAVSGEEAFEDLPLNDETVNYTVDESVTTDDKSQDILDSVNVLKNLKVMETIWTIAGNAVEILGKIEKFAVEPMLDLGDAVAKVDAQTGRAVENADKLINDIFYDDLGQSKDEIAGLIVQAAALNLPIEEATRAALTFTHTWSDVDSTTAITTFGALLKTNLVGSMQEAADLMAVFFQEGGNKGNDAIAVIQANAESWSNMGLTGSEALSAINSLLDGNVDSATDAAKMIQTLDDNLTAAADKADSPQADMLRQMGLKNPKDEGKAMGADFIDGFAEAFATLPPDQQDLASGLFMGKGGKKFTGAIEEMTASSDIFASITGAAELAATDIDNSLRGAIDDFMKMAEEAAVKFLSSEQIDLPGKMDALKLGLQNALTVLGEGGTLSDAFSIALKPIGFDDEFQGLESALGNFVIAILQAVAIAQDIAGQGKAAEGTRITIAKLGEQQLDFDLTVGNPDEVSSEIETAISRGVTPEKIAASVADAVSTLVSQGAADQAQLLIAEIKKAQDDKNANVTLTPSGSVINVEPVIPDTALATLQGQLDMVNANAAKSAILTAQDAVLNGVAEVAPTVDAFHQTVTASVQPAANMTTALNDVLNEAKDAAPKVDELANSADNVTGSADVASTALGNMVSWIEEVIAKANSVSTTADKQAQVDSDAIVSTGGFGGTGEGKNTPMKPSDDNGLAAALNGYIPMGSMPLGGGNSPTVNNFNNIQNTAQADALGYRTAAQLRGMA